VTIHGEYSGKIFDTDPSTIAVTYLHWHLPGLGSRVAVTEEREWYRLQELKPVPHRLLEIQSKPPLRHPELISALDPIVVVTMPGVAETFKSVIDEMTHGTDFKLLTYCTPNMPISTTRI
jgi:hypothetical protein